MLFGDDDGSFEKSEAKSAKARQSAKADWRDQLSPR
jgi:hypothetical protein